MFLSGREKAVNILHKRCFLINSADHAVLRPSWLNQTNFRPETPPFFPVLRTPPGEDSVVLRGFRGRVNLFITFSGGPTVNTGSAVPSPTRPWVSGLTQPFP